MKMFFKCGTNWATFQDFGFGYPYNNRENTTYIALNLRGIRKEVFNRFLRDNIKFMGVAGYCYLDVVVDVDQIKNLKQVLAVSARFNEVRDLFIEYANEKITFDKFYEAMLPSIFCKSFSRSKPDR